MEYYIEQLDFEDSNTIQMVLALLNESFPNANFDRAWWTWKYLQSPFGLPLGWGAKELVSNRIISVRILWRWKLCKGNKYKEAFQFIDSATDINYRGKGIYSLLTKKALEYIKDSIIFDFPNSNSAPINLKLGWTNFGNISWLVGVTYPIFLHSCNTRLIKMDNNISWKPESNSGHNYYSTKWTSELLEWRFKKHPNNNIYCYFSLKNTVVIVRIDKIKCVKVARIMYEENLMEEYNSFITSLFKENVFFYLYNAYNKDLYKKLKSKIGVFKIKRSFLFFGKNISQDSIALDLSDTDFL